jgi:hypothetical protein|tara:strand:+ start:5446 stop:5577 length:132 start_codon:yes stop_codon:yes gene_type:complete
MTTEKEKWIRAKIKKIHKEGIRGKKPKKGQAYAVAQSMYRRRK